MMMSASAGRGGGERGSYRVIDFNAGKFCSGHIVDAVLSL
jgi:hypothetical protein